MSGERETPARGTTAIPADEQARYDADQDARLRDHSTQLQATRAEVAAAIAHDAAQDADLKRLRRGTIATVVAITVGWVVLFVLITRTDAALARQFAPPPAPVVHCPAAPAATCAPTLTCAACPACPQLPERRHR